MYPPRERWAVTLQQRQGWREDKAAMAPRTSGWRGRRNACAAKRRRGWKL